VQAELQRSLRWVSLAAACGLIDDARASELRVPKLFMPAGSGLPAVELQLRLAEGVEPTLDASGRLLPGPGLQALVDLQDQRSIGFRSLFGSSGDRIESLRVRALALSGRPQPNLRNFLVVVPRGPPSPSDLAALGNELRRLPMVTWVGLEPLGVPPPADIPPFTPDLSDTQAYRRPADGGYDMTAASRRQLRGAGVRIADIEYAWINEHEDLSNVFEEPLQEIPNDTLDRVFGIGRAQAHGAAVLGVLGAESNAYGMTGLAPEAQLATYPEFTREAGSRRAAAIVAAAADSAEGDILVLEMQTTGPGGDYGPAELSLPVWQAVKMATDAGLVVLAAAGNGAQDLDDPDYQPYLSRGDSGAIIVGAGSADASHRPLNFSTYGARVDVQGWGQEVASIGYGNLAIYGDDVRQSYTDRFGGTSSATPVVAGVAALIQERARQILGRSLRSVELRDALVETGVAQGVGLQRPIGPFPDLEAALVWVEDREVVLEPLVIPMIDEGALVTLSAQASAVEGGPLRYEWKVGDDTEFEGAVVEWQAGDDADVPLRLLVRSAFGAETRTSTSIRVGNLSPVLELEGPAVVTENEEALLPVRVRDPGGDAVELRLSGPIERTRARLDEDTLRFVPAYEDALAGGTRFTITAEDDDGGRSELLVDVDVDFQDQDMDGVPDTWEEMNGLDPDDPADALTDPDQDGRNQRDEFAERSDPFRSDRPRAPRLSSPSPGAVVDELSFEIQARSPEALHRVRLFGADGNLLLASDELRPGAEGRLAWSPDLEPTENAMLTWEASAFDAYAEELTGRRALVFSRVDEPPEAPVIRAVNQTQIEEEVHLVVDLEAVPDPEQQPLRLQLRVRQGGRTVAQTKSAPTLEPVQRLILRIPAQEGARWSARAVDPGGQSSPWTEARPIPIDGGCRCAGSATQSFSSSWLLALLGLLLVARRRTAPARRSSGPRLRAGEGDPA